jgi:hypothetical protein
LRGEGGAVGRLGLGRPAGWRLGTHPTGGSHLSAAEGRRGGRRRLGRLGPVRPREKEKMLGRKRPNNLKEGFLNFLNKIICEMLFQLLKILPLLK